MRKENDIVGRMVARRTQLLYNPLSFVKKKEPKLQSGQCRGQNLAGFVTHLESSSVAQSSQLPFLSHNQSHSFLSDGSDLKHHRSS